MNRPQLPTRRLALVLGAIVFLAVLAPFVVAAVPQLVGADHSYVVRTSSMSPTIKAGDMVLVSSVSAGQIERGDVITFTRSVGTETRRITHRVVSVVQRDGRRLFRTKGDANESPDAELVTSAQVTGVVTLTVPLVGYAVAFAGTTLGTALLVIVPAIALVVSELYDLLASRGDRDSAVEADGGETVAPSEANPSEEDQGGEP